MSAPRSEEADIALSGPSSECAPLSPGVVSFDFGSTVGDGVRVNIPVSIFDDAHSSSFN